MSRPHLGRRLWDDTMTQSWNHLEAASLTCLGVMLVTAGSSAVVLGRTPTSVIFMCCSPGTSLGSSKECGSRNRDGASLQTR